MSELLTSISLVEKEMSLLDGILHHVYIYDKASTDLIVRMRIGEDTIDYKTSVIGGLVCTIDDFAGEKKSENYRYVTLEKLKLIFVLVNKYLIVIACDPEYPVSQFEKFMRLFESGFSEGYKIQNYGDSIDGACLSFQIIKSLISEDISIELFLSEKSNMFPFKLQELAENIIDDELTKSSSNNLAQAMDETSGKYEKSVNQEENIEMAIPEMDVAHNQTQALHMLLDRFATTFSDITSITFIHTNNHGNLERITKGNISRSLEANILNIVLGMIDTVSLILEDDIDARTLDLGDHWIYFHQVSLSSFVYLIVETKDALELVIPLVERITSTIQNLFPEDGA